MVSAPLLLSDYSGIPLARPPTPIVVEKLEKVAMMSHLVGRRDRKQLATQLSFDFFESSKYFKKPKSRLFKKLSEPSLFDIRRLKPEAKNKLLSFGQLISKRLRRRYPSKVESIISLTGLFGEHPVLLRPRKQVSKRMTRRLETFNLSLLFGSEQSPTYSQQQTPVESFHVVTDTAMSTPVESIHDTLSEISTIPESCTTISEEASHVTSEPTTVSSVRTPTPDIATGFRTRRLINTWNQKAKMMQFVRNEPMPKPPFSAFFGLRGSVSERIYEGKPKKPDPPKVVRRVSSGVPVPQVVLPFVSTVDSSSIYDDVKQLPETDPNCVYHVLKARSPRPDGFESPELLPEHMVAMKRKNDRVVQQLNANNRLMAVEDETFDLLTNQHRNINWRPAAEKTETVIDIDLEKLGDAEIDLTPSQTPKRNGTLLFIQHEQNRRRKR